MLPEIKAQYHDGILRSALTAFGLQQEQVKEDLEGFESEVYAIQGPQDQDYILKITHTLRRSPDYLMGELDFVHYLAEHGMSVSRPIQSKQGTWIEVLSQQEQTHPEQAFLAILYEKIPGRELKKADLTPQLFEQLGALMGKMHQLSQNYQLPEARWKRRDWHEEDLFDFERWLPREQHLVLKNAYALVERLKKRAIQPNTYGLVHSDLHDGNFFITDSKADNCPDNIWVFDFDDCEYHWFANDIAISFFYLVHRFHEPQDWHQAMATFFPPFWRHYSQFNPLPLEELRDLNDFLMLRDIVLYTLIHQVEDIEKLKPKSQKHLQERRQWIEKQDTCVEWPAIFAQLCSD